MNLLLQSEKAKIKIPFFPEIKQKSYITILTLAFEFSSVMLVAYSHSALLTLLERLTNS